MRVALAQERGEPVAKDEVLLAAVQRLHEQNPMLGLRGVRLGIVVPGLFGMQVRAIAQAAAAVRGRRDRRRTRRSWFRWSAPLQELQVVADEIDAVLAEESERTGLELGAPIGTMIELPRAALTAGRIAESARFFSFGTNDLTQTTWGFSRDDVEGSFFARYREQGIFDGSPFETLDTEGVGRLIALAAREGRAARPDCSSACAANTGATPTPSTSSTTRAWTTSPAHRSGSPRPASKRVARLWTADRTRAPEIRDLGRPTTGSGALVAPIGLSDHPELQLGRRLRRMGRVGDGLAVHPDPAVADVLQRPLLGNAGLDQPLDDGAFQHGHPVGRNVDHLYHQLTLENVSHQGLERRR